MEKIHKKLLYHLVNEYNIKLKYVQQIMIGERFNVYLNEYENVCDIYLLKHEHMYKTLSKFKVFENHLIVLHYMGEYSENPASKSYLCKRTQNELDIINRSVNPCTGCDNINECSTEECIAIRTLKL